MPSPTEAHHQVETKYATLEDVDIEDIGSDTDTTACSESPFDETASRSGGQGRDRSGRSRRHEQKTRAHTRRECLAWARWATVVTLQLFIFAFLAIGRAVGDGRGSSCVAVAESETETGGDVNGLYVPTSHTYMELVFEPEIYVPNMTTDANRQEVRHNWDMLMPLGSGSVSIPDWRDHPHLGKPIIDDPLRSGPLFEASWTHALHCLYYTIDTYHQLLLHGRNGEENPYHATHCFEYLRTNILCSADMTLEGQTSAVADQGHGQPHQCRNRDEAIKWIEDRRLDDLQDIIGP